MIIQLKDIAFTRSGDKGRNSNIGVIFMNTSIYSWAKINLTTEVVKKHLEYKDHVSNCFKTKRNRQ